MRKRAVYVERLEAVFHAIIEDGGQDKHVLTEKRLAEILANPKVKAYFSTLEIDVQESAALFNLLDNGDGMVTLEEFINGIMRCKGPARAIDTFALHSDVKQLDAKLRALMRMSYRGPGDFHFISCFPQYAILRPFVCVLGSFVNSRTLHTMRIHARRPSCSRYMSRIATKLGTPKRGTIVRGLGSTEAMCRRGRTPDRRFGKVLGKIRRRFG